jgi:GntR family transcriptional regulator
VLSEDVREATLEESELFAIAPGADLFELARLRMLDGLPVAVDRAAVPLRRAPRLTDVDWTTASLYAELAAAGAEPVSAAYTLEAQPADAEEAELLGLAPGAPVLVTTTSTHDAEGRLVEVTRTAYRGDRYRFHATLTRRRNHTRRER